MTQDFSPFVDGQVLNAAELNAALAGVDSAAQSAVAAAATLTTEEAANATAAAHADADALAAQATAAAALATANAAATAQAARVGNGVTGVILKRPPLASVTLQNTSAPGAVLRWPTGAVSDATADCLVLQAAMVSGGSPYMVWADAAVSAAHSVVVGIESDYGSTGPGHIGVVFLDANGVWHRAVVYADAATSAPYPSVYFGPASAMAPYAAGSTPASVVQAYPPAGGGRLFFALDYSAGLSACIAKVGTNGRLDEMLPFAAYPLTAPIVRAGFLVFPEANDGITQFQSLVSAANAKSTVRLIHLDAE